MGNADGCVEHLDTSSDDGIVREQSVSSTTTHDELECFGPDTVVENGFPIMADFLVPVTTEQSAAMFYHNFWPESQFQSSFPVYTMSPGFVQLEPCSQMNVGQDDLQSEANLMIDPPQSSNSDMHQGHEVLSHTMPQPQTVSVLKDHLSGRSEIAWHVDARKLRSGDKQAVSPAFELPLGNQFPAVTFKMMLYPSKKSEGKGGASFKNAKGQGTITIKCEGDVSGDAAEIDFSLAIGSRGVRISETKHGKHNFAHSAICSLSRHEADWNLSSVVDQASETFSVFLTMTPVQS